MNNPLEKALFETDANGFIDESSDDFLFRSISKRIKMDVKHPEKLIRLGYLFEREGIQRYKNWAKNGNIRYKSLANGEIKNKEKSIFDRDVTPAFEKSFLCWRSLLSENDESGFIDVTIKNIINTENFFMDILPENSLAFHLSVSGILSLHPAEVRLELKKWKPDNENNSSWKDLLIKTIAESFILLTRKNNGWKDIDEALKKISGLRALQPKFEELYIDSNGENDEKVKVAVELVALYHIAQMISYTAKYLQTGEQNASSVYIQLNKHHDHANDAFQTSNKEIMKHFSDLIWIGCREIVQNSIWTHSAILPPRVKDFVKLISDRGKPNPIIELWPAQQEALARNLLTTYHRAILVEMPTSAGKTLLAKFAIVQTKALNSLANIVYIVPTRALVNQVTYELRSDFKELNPPLTVEMAVPAFELDPTEDIILQEPPDILVTTPEKLDLLVRSKHPAVSNISMVIADEAHNIQAGERGARLELLLGTLKREFENARFLLLSPFLPNNQEILSWIGGGLALPAITVDWRPGNRIVGAIDIKGKGNNKHLVFESLPAANNNNIKHNRSIILGYRNVIPPSKTLGNMTKSSINSFIDRGSILVLCRGKLTAAQRAQEIAKDFENIEESTKLKAICSFLNSEAGIQTPLVQCLKKGVAYHHAGISHEARWLIECLLKEKIVNVVCGTTTLAQGVNFPISTVIVETLNKGEDPLDYDDFWNIAGRAGRTLMDSVGIVGFPINSKDKRKQVNEFLEKEARIIASQLANLIIRADEISENFNMAAIIRNPTLSSLLQFLAHAMRISESTDIADQVENIMRDSLVYNQLNARNEIAAKKLLFLCKKYLIDLSGKTNIKSLLTLADSTGFSTPSVLGIQGKIFSELKQLKDISYWNPESLFSFENDMFTNHIKVVSEVPEIRLGWGKGGPFNPERVSDVLKDWVNGVTLNDLAEKYKIDNRNNQKNFVYFSDYLFKLIGLASWGIGSLEGVCLAGLSDEEKNQVGYVPSMVFYGVKNKEAVWMRMVGVPRVLADGLGEIWKEQKNPAPKSYKNIRKWVNNLTEKDWGYAIPKKSEMTPEYCKIIWELLS